MAYDRYHFPVAIIGEYKYKAAGWNGSCRLLVVVMTEQSKISSSLHFPPIIYYLFSGKRYTTKQEILKRFIGTRKRSPIFPHTRYKEYPIDNHNILW